MTRSMPRGLLSPASVSDARGARVRLVGQSRSAPVGAWGTDIDPAQKARAWRAMLLAVLIASPAFLLPALLLPTLTRVIIGSPPSYGAGRITLLVLVGAATGVLGPLVMIFVGRRLMAADIARFVVERGLCASCDYPIDGVPEAEDGCTVCPECGAAWRREGQVSGSATEQEN